MDKLFSLTDKTAIVTGGNREIGLGISKLLAESGCNVVIANRNPESGKEAVETVKRDTGGEAISFPVDVQKKQDVEELVVSSIEKYGRVDILVNNAAIRGEHLIIDMPEEEWDSVMNVNVKGPFLLSQAVGRHMIDQESGKIINISSIREIIARSYRGAYCASKGALSQLTRALAVEFAEYGITVNAVAPGTVLTAALKSKYEESPDKFEKKLDTIPLGRAATSEDIAAAVAFLAGPASDYITGQTIFVDGGRMVSD